MKRLNEETFGGHLLTGISGEKNRTLEVNFKKIDKIYVNGLKIYDKFEIISNNISLNKNQIIFKQILKDYDKITVYGDHNDTDMQQTL